MELARNQLLKHFKKCYTAKNQTLFINDYDNYKECHLRFFKKCKSFNKILELLEVSGWDYEVEDAGNIHQETDYQNGKFYNWKTKDIWIKIDNFENYLYFKQFDSDYQDYISGYYGSIPEFIKPFIINEMPEHRRHLFN